MATVEESMALAMEQMESEEAAGGESAGQEASPAAGTEKPAPAARARGEGGKFAKGDNAVPPDQEQVEERPAEELKPEVAKPVVKEVVQPTVHKAPVSWRPEVRGKFGALPADIQEEVVRREREIETGMRESSQARRFAGEFMQTIQPYAAMIQSENATPLQAVQSLMNTAYQLRTAAPQQKAQLVAQLISQFGVDIEMLDTVLSQAVQPRGGGHTLPQNDPSLRFLEQKLAPVEKFMERFTQMEQNAQNGVATKVQNEIDAFANDPANEYWNDVKPDVADILEMAARRGQIISLPDAYKRATMAHPTISKLIADKTLANSAQQRSSAAQRSRAASASLPSGGAPGQGGSGGAAKPKDLFSAVEAAWDHHAEQSKD